MELLDIFILILGSIFSYLLGGVSIARLITKKEKGGDIKTQGSGNPGTMNMLRTHGFFMGIFTLICDALKGVLPALFGLLYFRQIDYNLSYTALYLFGLCAVVGHIFPVYYKFKGGKGIATTLGVFMVADPITSLILFAILFVTLYFIKISSVVSLLFITINAIIQLFKPYCEGNWVLIVLMLVMIALDIWAHRQNLVRLIENKENVADIQEGLRKDIEKIKNKQERKVEKSEQKTENIRQKYERKIIKKHNKVNKKIEKISEKNANNEIDKNLNTKGNEQNSPNNNVQSQLNNKDNKNE
ncbi:MAG: glycerol-3-phosphate 1-O-acyltransferase PlsY [Christensenellales bacterium]